MAFGTILGGVASAAAGFGLNKLFGGKSGSAQAPIQNFRPSGFNAGGLGAKFGADGNLTITPTAERLGLVRGVSDTFGNLAGEFGALRGRVAPGVSDLRTARLAEIEDARSSAIGNLRENLARRRVLGSSFGQDAISRAEAEFAGARDKVAAESFLQEFELTNQLIQQEAGAARAAFQTNLDELNLQADVATKLAGNATGALAGNARVLAELNAREAAGAGKFFGQTIQPVTAGVGRAVQNWWDTPSAGFFGGSPATNPNLVPIGA
jgi:hypothetical protein